MAKQNNESFAILLVDDDDDCRMIVREAISQSKVSNCVLEARDGREALALLRNSSAGSIPRPGLIYLDVEMPGMDGQATLREIKSDPDLQDIPVVMMTGLRDERQRRDAAAAGASSYTLKPANAEQFLRTVIAGTDYCLNIHPPTAPRPPETARRRS